MSAGKARINQPQPAKLVILLRMFANIFVLLQPYCFLRQDLHEFMERSQNTFALVTGASSGMGLEYARQLAAKGHNILVVSNRDEDNRKVAEMLHSEYGVSAVPYYADLSKSRCFRFLRLSDLFQ